MDTLIPYFQSPDKNINELVYLKAAELDSWGQLSAYEPTNEDVDKFFNRRGVFLFPPDSLECPTWWPVNFKAPTVADTIQRHRSDQARIEKTKFMLGLDSKLEDRAAAYIELQIATLKREEESFRTNGAGLKDQIIELHRVVLKMQRMEVDRSVELERETEWEGSEDKEEEKHEEDEDGTAVDHEINIRGVKIGGDEKCIYTPTESTFSMDEDDLLV